MTTPFTNPGRGDAELVAQSRAGDRQAFGQIVDRYQSLVCAVTYSATGSRTRSEDLAQETFVAAWCALRELREPGRLGAWLCGIARNLIHSDLRRMRREPAHDAASLDIAPELASSDPLPTAQAVSNEEMAILWREVGRLPEAYREPLILYYREHRSVETVAAALDLTPDAVMQRLNRGRRQLRERMLLFVESTLERTNPGQAFTVRVQAVLPVLAALGPMVAGRAGSSAAGAAKGGVVGSALAWAAPLVGVFAAIGVTWSEIARARTGAERRYVVRWMIWLWLCAAAWVVALPLVGRWAASAGLSRRSDWLATAPMVAVWFGYAVAAVTLIILMIRGRAALRRRMIAAGSLPAGATARGSRAGQLAITLAVLTAVFWALIFMAWRTGDRVVAGAIGAAVIVLSVLPVIVLPGRVRAADEAKVGGWYLAGCGLVFLAILNLRLDVWLATAYAVDLGTMHRLLPMGLIHGLSLALVGWTVGLVFATRRGRQP